MSIRDNYKDYTSRVKENSQELEIDEKKEIEEIVNFGIELIETGFNEHKKYIKKTKVSGFVLGASLAISIQSVITILVMLFK